MPAKTSRICFTGFFLLTVHAIAAMAQLTPSQAGYLDAVADFGADSTGESITTGELQSAINAATSQHKPLYIPPGTYLIDNTLVVEDGATDSREQNTFIAGSSADPRRRTTIVLQSGTFTNQSFRRQVILYKKWDGYTNTFHGVIQNIDIVIEENNAGAIGLRWRGAEGCGIFDVHIDARGGFAGLEMLPGSGGSAANISITGGQYGIWLPSGSTQPTPTITGVTLRNQSQAAICSHNTRGALTITGGRFIMKNGVPTFDLARINWFGHSPGGNPVLTDCVIEYTSPDSENLVMVMEEGRDQSVHFSDVYVKHAATILDEDVTVSSNINGWRHYKDLSYNSGWDEVASGDEPIYLNGSKTGNSVYQEYTDGVPPPPNIQRKHSWGNTFPGFDSYGAVNVKDFYSYVDNGDWAPAFNAAIESAESSGSNIVFVPAGNYVIYNTIFLKSRTALIGAGHHNSRILGRDDEGRRFGGSTSSWTDPKPMIRTPDDKSAACVLADIAVSVNGPYNADEHTPEAMACYAILWRAGNNSVIRNIDYMRSNRSRYRAAWSLLYELTSQEWLNLRSLPSPSELNGLTFESECAHGYHTSETVPSRILLETVNGTRRIMTRSLPPRMFNNTENSFDIPNLTIRKTDEKPFDISSVTIANAAWDPAEGSEVTIKGYGGSGGTVTVSLEGISRETLQTVVVDWTGVNKVVITSRVPFSISELEIDSNVFNFQGIQGESLKEGTDFHHWCSGYGYYYLPMFYMAHPYVIIEGGCKYYNHWKHGSTWLRITEPYVLIRNNDPDHIVSIYHSHAQHSQNFYKFKIEDAHNVSLFGTKTENALEFARVENGHNIRLMGHGGMTNPPAGTAHYRVENSSDYKIVSPTDEIVTTDECLNCNLGDVMLPRTAFGTYDVIQEVYGEDTLAPVQTDRPIMYRRGDPVDPWGGLCENYVALEVINGTGSNYFCQGAKVTISAIVGEFENFSHWTGDTEFLDDSTNVSAVVTMPGVDISLRAVVVDLPSYTLTVEGGTGTGEYFPGQEVIVRAGVPECKFEHWAGDTQYLPDTAALQVEFTMPERDVTLTAMVNDKIVSTLTVIDGEGSGDYCMDQIVSVTIDYHKGDSVFYQWSGTGTPYVEDISGNVTTITIPDHDVTLIPVYKKADVLEFKNISRRNYRQMILTAGVRYYYDRTVTVAGLPDYLDRLHFIQTANDDRDVAIDSFLLFYIARPAILYAAYDRRASSLPQWLSDWEPLPEKIEVTDGAMDYLDVYRKSYSPGYVCLGGNMQSPATGALSMYFVAGVPVGDAVTYSLDLYASNGIVTADPEKEEYEGGETVTVTAVPDDGFEFAGWTGDAGGQENPLQVIMDADKSITAGFEPVTGAKRDEYDAGTILIYPNPSGKGWVKIRTPAPSMVAIYDMKGREMMHYHDAYELEVDCSELNRGIYAVKIYAGDRVINRKLIVQ